MGTIVTWAQVIARYAELSKLPSVGSATVQDSWVSMAEASVNGRLASVYATPVSSTNLTARDLAIDTLYVQATLSRLPDKAEAVQKSLEARYKDLLSGAASMVSATGAVVATLVGDTVWSNTMDYHPVFGMGDPAVLAVSSGQLIDEDEARGGAGVAI